MRKQWGLWLASGALWFAPALAHAEDEPKAYPECTRAATDAETAAAKGAFQAGKASFDEADYPRAITYWEDAYRRDCSANLLLPSLARAYELNGQKRQAVVALETYLVREPSSPDKDQIQRRVEVLKRQIAAEKAAPVAAAPVPPAPVPPAPVESAPTSVETEPSQTTGHRPIAPLIVAGVGGVALVVGVVVYAAGSKEYNDAKKACGGTTFCTGDGAAEKRDAGDKARNKKIAGGVVMGVGGAVLAGGLLWYFLSPRSSGTATGSLLKPRVDPAVTPGFAGLSLSGAF